MKAMILAVAMSAIAMAAASAAPAVPHCTAPLGSLTYSCPAARMPVVRPAVAARSVRPVARVMTHRVVTHRRLARVRVPVTRRVANRSIAPHFIVGRRYFYRVERGNWDRAYAQGAYNYHSGSYAYQQAPSDGYAHYYFYNAAPPPAYPSGAYPSPAYRSRNYGYNPGDGGPPASGERLSPWANYDSNDGPENGY